MTGDVEARDEAAWHGPSRVEESLARAAPCSHVYIELPGGYLVCEDCRRIQKRDASFCLVCEEPGEVGATLISVSEPALSCSGRLCNACAREFRERRVIAGWLADLGPNGGARRGRAA